MKKEEQAKIEKRKAYAFLTIILLSTIVFLVVILAMIIESVKYKSYKDIAKKGLTILGTEMFSLQEGDYYIYLYSSKGASEKLNKEKQEALEPYIVNYFTFVKQNKRKGSVCEIRLMDVDESKNARCLSDHTTTSASSWTSFYVDEASLPALVYLTVNSTTGGGYSYAYEVITMENDIKGRLADSISSFTTVAYIPKREETAFC